MTKDCITCGFPVATESVKHVLCPKTGHVWHAGCWLGAEREVEDLKTARTLSKASPLELDVAEFPAGFRVERLTHELTTALEDALGQLEVIQDWLQRHNHEVTDRFRNVGKKIDIDPLEFLNHVTDLADQIIYSLGESPHTYNLSDASNIIEERIGSMPDGKDGICSLADLLDEFVPGYSPPMVADPDGEPTEHVNNQAMVDDLWLLIDAFRWQEGLPPDHRSRGLLELVRDRLHPVPNVDLTRAPEPRKEND